jgi:hypothetical protein
MPSSDLRGYATASADNLKLRVLSLAVLLGMPLAKAARLGLTLALALPALLCRQ